MLINKPISTNQITILLYEITSFVSGPPMDLIEPLSALSRLTHTLNMTIVTTFIMVIVMTQSQTINIGLIKAIPTIKISNGTPTSPYR